MGQFDDALLNFVMHKMAANLYIFFSFMEGLDLCVYGRLIITKNHGMTPNNTKVTQQPL